MTRQNVSEIMTKSATPRKDVTQYPSLMSHWELVTSSMKLTAVIPTWEPNTITQ